MLRVGNLEPVRDFCDVRDVVAAYGVLLARGVRGEAYNVGSGRGRPIRAVLDHLLARSRARPAVEVDPARYRAVAPDALALVGDASPAARARLGAAATPSTTTLDALLEFYRARGVMQEPRAPAVAGLDLARLAHAAPARTPASAALELSRSLAR